MWELTEPARVCRSLTHGAVHLTSVGLSFLVYKMSLTVSAAPGSCCPHDMRSCMCSFAPCLVHGNHSVNSSWYDCKHLALGSAAHVHIWTSPTPRQTYPDLGRGGILVL